MGVLYSWLLTCCISMKWIPYRVLPYCLVHFGFGKFLNQGKVFVFAEKEELKNQSKLKKKGPFCAYSFIMTWKTRCLQIPLSKFWGYTPLLYGHECNIQQIEVTTCAWLNWYYSSAQTMKNTFLIEIWLLFVAFAHITGNKMVIPNICHEVDPSRHQFSQFSCILVLIWYGCNR